MAVKKLQLSNSLLHYISLLLTRMKLGEKLSEVVSDYSPGGNFFATSPFRLPYFPI